jgi:DeoR/GlpR family transcriptional regulator of sugar metabolism
MTPKRANAAASFARLGDAKTVMIDYGTNTQALAEPLRECQGVTVIATSLPITSAPNSAKAWIYWFRAACFAGY